MEVTIGNETKHYRTVWLENETVKMIDQPLLPHKFEILDLKDYHETARAIKDMNVRGAGAIGATAGYAMAQAVMEAPAENFQESIEQAKKEIEATRPTAQNLFYATNKVFEAMQKAGSVEEKKKIAVETAQAIADEDAEYCRLIGQNGEKLIHNDMRVLTHCNAGWLAFVDWGSALAPVFAAKRNGKKVFVFADETRPRCQGARLTAWELMQEKIDFAVIADNAAGHYMKQGEIDLVITGSDRIAANGDVANKIGTYEKAVVAKENGIPFYVAAPTTTIDRNCPSGDDIPIEERSEDEVLTMFGKNKDGIESVRLAPEKASARNPAFDVTPAKYVAGLITEKGIVKASPEGIKSLFQ
jgi:S-methyl-5-thioribose-1-phosphate isomerase